QFSGLSPIDITGMALVQLPTPPPALNPNAVVTIANGFDFFHGGTNAALRVSGSTGNVAFETVAVWNVTTLLIDMSAQAGNDIISIDSANNAGVPTNLTINTGTGTDVVNLNGPISISGAFTVSTASIGSTAT